jgi:predicted nucleic acid-binding protein
LDRYFDTGALLKIYHTEAGSEQASAIALRSPALPMGFVLEIELKNAIRALYGRELITLEALEQMIECIESDIAGGRLLKLSLDSARLEKTAFELSERHTKDILCRSLDILHVATAICAEVPIFVTGDKRQAQLAEAAGLTVEFIKIPSQQ